MDLADTPGRGATLAALALQARRRTGLDRGPGATSGDGSYFLDLPSTRGGNVRIAQVAPLFENVPPRQYGGTERVVSYLTEELVRQGHQVTLFATAESRTEGELVPVVERPLRGDPNWLVHALVQLELVMRRAEDFDILHFHTDHIHYPLIGLTDVPMVATLHGRLDLPGLV